MNAASVRLIGVPGLACGFVTIVLQETEGGSSRMSRSLIEGSPTDSRDRYFKLPKSGFGSCESINSSTLACRLYRSNQE